MLIEKGKGDFYSAYIPNNPLPYGIMGDGYSVEEAKADFEQSYAEMRAFHAEQNMPFKEAEFSFKTSLITQIDNSKVLMLP
ncbi:MAG: hypothetical protein II502_05645 [Paludibacteraceae bacterium]|nr:hypothetical protein [Paludibacteraceae bacterium]